MHSRRAADGAAGVLPDADHAQVRGHARAGAAGGAARVAPRVVGVADEAEARAHVARCELAHVGLGDDERARVLHACDDGGIPGRHEVREEGRSVGGRQVAGLDLILEENRDAVQRPAESAGGEGGVEAGGLVEGGGVQVGDGVEPRSLLVVGFDAVEVTLHQVDAGQLSGEKRGVHLRDGCFLELEILGERTGRGGQEQAGGQQEPGRAQGASAGACSPCRGKPSGIHRRSPAGSRVGIRWVKAETAGAAGRW